MQSTKLLAIPVLVAVAVIYAGAPAVAQAARPLELGISDFAHFGSRDRSIRVRAFDRAVSARAQHVLIGVRWSSVAPAGIPIGFSPADPADPHYDWAAIDEPVRDAAARGLRVTLLVTGAPAFAEGPGRPPESVAPAGSWRPDPGAVANFGHAIASRYSGRFAGLPRVDRYQLWAEPNLGLNLSPQRSGRKNHLVGGKIYRRMLNAFYAGVNSADSGGLVITGGTAPYGDLVGPRGPVLGRTQPLAFWRQALCVTKRRARPERSGRPLRRWRRRERRRRARCGRVHFDVLAHDPINVGRPGRGARNGQDVSTPDIGKLRALLRRARRTGRIRPRGGKPIWATEIWWNSNPPKAGGVPLWKHAHWLEQSLWLLWRQKVSAVFWLEVRDPPPSTLTPQSGLFFGDGSPKPAYQAFRFPFVTKRLPARRGKGHRGRDRRGALIRVWGKAPGPGRVLIQRAHGHGWKKVKRLKAGRSRVFTGTITLPRRKGTLRALSGSEASLPWRQK